MGSCVLMRTGRGSIPAPVLDVPGLPGGPTEADEEVYEPPEPSEGYVSEGETSGSD
jgi:hypothetical protein